MPQLLKGKVTLVAGAMRGVGHGIAVKLGTSSATVYGFMDLERPEPDCWRYRTLLAGKKAHGEAGF